MAFDWKKTGMKILKSTVYIFLAGLASMYGQNPYYLAIAPLLHGLENYLKHRKD